MDGNIHEFVEKVLDDEDQEHLVAIWNKVHDRNLHLALLPFINHDAMIRTLNEHLRRVRMADRNFNNPEAPHIRYIEYLVHRLGGTVSRLGKENEDF